MEINWSIQKTEKYLIAIKFIVFQKSFSFNSICLLEKQNAEILFYLFSSIYM